uniref:hypothetical protein n=1 Tax=Alistipes indistinctus TaxID=626932 RepID=UPI004027BFFB
LFHGAYAAGVSVAGYRDKGNGKYPDVLICIPDCITFSTDFTDRIPPILQFECRRECRIS